MITDLHFKINVVAHPVFSSNYMPISFKTKQKSIPRVVTHGHKLLLNCGIRDTFLFYFKHLLMDPKKLLACEADIR